MKTHLSIHKSKLSSIAIILIATMIISCEDFVNVDPPATHLVTSTVFNNDATADAAMLGVYQQLATNGFASGDLLSIPFLAALSSDELVNFNVSSFTQELNDFNSNNLLETNALVEGVWSAQYQNIYKVNAVIEGLAQSTGVSEAVKNKLTGEAKFIRAFNYFYLVNLFGDVPLVLTTNYNVNANIGRSNASDVYQQIISDLRDAQTLLQDVTNPFPKLRATSGSASALLARTYLYVGDWANAEAEATKVIDLSYQLEEDLSLVFKNTSQEAIFQLARDNQNSPEARLFTFTDAPTNAALTESLISYFENSDARLTHWVKGPGPFYHPAKYVDINYDPVTEYTVVLRLAEVILIRAEARAMLNNIDGAQADLNMIRMRADLAGTTADDQASLLEAIIQERRVELFTEWGHRWLDLKRVNKADDILESVKPGWQSTDKLYPIPYVQLMNDPAMTDQQNPGY